MSKSKNKMEDEWVEGMDFSFGNSLTRSSKRGRRDSGMMNQVKISNSKDRRKTMMLKRLDMAKGFQYSPPISRRTRRQSMAALPTAKSDTRNDFSRTKSEKSLGKNQSGRRKLQVANNTSSKTLLADKRKDVSKNEVIKTVFYKSPLRTRSIGIKPPADDNKTADNTGMTKKRPPLHRNRGAVHLTFSNQANNKLSTNAKAPTKLANAKPSTTTKPPTNTKPAVKKPLKRLSTPNRSPAVPNRRLTRSTKKKVHISAESPVLTVESYRKTPRIQNVQDTKTASSKRKKSIQKRVLPFTPIPDDPGKIIKQNMRKRLVKELISGDTDATTMTTLVSLPTPKLSRPASLRKVRKIHMNSNEVDLFSSSTPIKSSEKSPLTDHDMLNISDVSTNSASNGDVIGGEANGSYNEPIANGINDVDLPKMETQKKNDKRGYCILM